MKRRRSWISLKLKSLPEGIAKRHHPKEGNHAEHRGHRLPKADGPRDRGATQHEGCQQGQFDAPGLSARDAVSA